MTTPIGPGGGATRARRVGLPTPPTTPAGTGSALRRFLTKWLSWNQNGKWVWIPLGILFLPFCWTVYTAGRHGAWWFVFSLIGVMLLIGMYNFAQKKLGHRFNMPAVQPATVIIALMVPVFCWFFWAIKPEWYAEWRNSTFFALFILAGFMLGWLSGQGTHGVVKVARSALIGLCVLSIGFGAVRKYIANDEVKKRAEQVAKAERDRVRAEYCKHNLSAEGCTPTELFLTLVIKPGVEVSQVIPPDYDLQWRRTECDKVYTEVRWEGHDMYRVFKGKPNIDSAVFYGRLHYDPVQRPRGEKCGDPFPKGE